MYDIKELQEMLGIQFSDDDAVDALRQHEMACYVFAHPEVIPVAAKESKNMGQFYSTLRRHTSSATEKFPVSLEISQRMQSTLCNMKRVSRYDFVHENKKYHVEGNGILFASAPVDVLVEDLSNGNVTAKYRLEAYSEITVGEMCKAASYVVDRDDAPKYRSWYITQEKTDMFKLKHDAMVAAQMYEHNKRVVDTGTRLIDFTVHTFVLRPGADIPNGLYEVLFVLNQIKSEGLSNEKYSI